MKTLAVALMIMVSSITLFAQNDKSLKVGDKAPEFKATTDDGSTWDLKNNLGNKYIVVYFYPAAMTSGCTTEACTYRDYKSKIESNNAIVVGVSGDNVDGLKLFKKAHDLNFPLLADPTGKIAKKFGVPLRNGGSITREVDGKTFNLVRGVTASRWTFIIDKNGKIVYKNENVNPAKDPEEVLNFIKNNT